MRFGIFIDAAGVNVGPGTLTVGIVAPPHEFQ
jgi:hypothetical protein